MAYVEVKIDALDIDRIEVIEGFRGGWSHQPLDKRPLRLKIVAEDGTEVHADMPKEAPEDAIALLEFVWWCLTYGGEDQKYEDALKDLRGAMGAQDARDRARRAG